MASPAERGVVAGRARGRGPIRAGAGAGIPPERGFDARKRCRTP